MQSVKPFLTAEWRKLAMANYAIDPIILADHIPNLTELDFHNGKCYVSLVGFMFLDTRVKGIRIPFHIDFEEINLRFYLRCHDELEIKRGVGFVKEIVPRAALTFIANMLYKEKYVTLPTRHTWVKQEKDLLAKYEWKTNRWNSLSINAEPVSTPIGSGSDEEFILEHYWGYTKVNQLTTFEYKVEHPRWQVYPVKEFNIDVDFGTLYGDKFAFLQHQQPESVFLVEGSEIAVYPKTTLNATHAQIKMATR